MEKGIYYNSESKSTKPERQYYIDWLRLIAVFLLFFFHTARIFDPREMFYAQSDSPSPVLYDTFIRSLNPWHMSLFFLLAGASTYYALRRRSGSQYIRERFKRLFIPFVFGVLVLIPPQSYIGLLQHSDYSKSYFSWFPDFFMLQGDDEDGYFMGGHTWGHLWFIFHLFVYSLIALPLFLYLNGESGRRRIRQIAGFFTKRGVILLVPLLIWPTNDFSEIAGGNPLFYILFFIFGFILMSDQRFMQTIDRLRYVLLILGPIIFAGYLITQGVNGWPSDLPGWADELFYDFYLDSFLPWLVILSLLAFGRRFLNFSNRFLRYFSEGAYALYILHQTIIVVIGYYVLHWELSIPASYSLILMLSFIGSVVAYDIVVRRTRITRFLFGMKTSKLTPLKQA